MAGKEKFGDHGYAKCLHRVQIGKINQSKLKICDQVNELYSLIE